MLWEAGGEGEEGLCTLVCVCARFSLAASVFACLRSTLVLFFLLSSALVFCCRNGRAYACVCVCVFTCRHEVVLNLWRLPYSFLSPALDGIVFAAGG